MGNVAPPRNLAELFLGFLSIGARSFGGVMPVAYRVLVEQRRWISRADFTETLGLCQFLPGPNVGNASVVLGRRWMTSRLDPLWLLAGGGVLGGLLLT